MKTIIRILTIICGIAALAVTVNMVYHTMWGHWQFGYVWSILFYWPGQFLYAIFSYREVIEKPILAVAIYALPVAAPLLAILQAKLLDRSKLDWFVVALFFPYMLTLLGARSKGQASKNPYGGALGHFFAAWRGKYCGRCEKAVPLSSRAGQRCPFCGAYWSYERTVQRG